MWQELTRVLSSARTETSTGVRRPRQTHLRFTLPNPYGGAPWVTATLAISSTPATQGDTVRIRGHIDSCFHSPEHPGDRDALAHETATPAPARGRALGRLGKRLAARAAKRGLDYVPRPLMQRLAEQRRQRWLDMQISTAPLDAGAAALMPAALKERYGDSLPRLVQGAPRVGVWSGPAGGPAGGMARLAMVQFDDSDLAGGRDADKDDRFSLNLTIGELIEPVIHRGRDGSD